jgi:hypothetical protein
MANISQPMTKAMLDWALTTGSPTRPAAWFGGLSLGSPTSVSNSEIGTGSGYTRQTTNFAAAGTPASSGTTINTVAMTFGPFSSAQSVSGLFINDSVSSGAGVQLFQGLLATARSPGAGDTLVVASGALVITLN